jgi:transcriptional regulator with XRE-family HTH domain
MTMKTNDDEKSAARLMIGHRIKELRTMRRMTQPQLAAKAHITNANIANIELGKYSAGVDILARIADALGARVDIVEAETV